VRPAQGVGGHAQDVRNAVGHFARASFQDAPAADAVVGTSSQPARKRLGTAELRPEVVAPTGLGGFEVERFYNDFAATELPAFVPAEH
jgi:hypothetical protein